MRLRDEKKKKKREKDRLFARCFNVRAATGILFQPGIMSLEIRSKSRFVKIQLSIRERRRGRKKRKEKKKE